MIRKLAITCCLFTTLHTTSARSKAEIEESRRNEASQVVLWENKLLEYQEKSDDEKMSGLWLGLRNMGYRMSRNGNSHDVEDIYQKLQNELLSIPGHAEYYAAPIWESYRAYRDPNHPKHTGSLTWFSSEILYGMQTLKHLPSPETVKALGGMLSEEWEREPSPNSDVAPSQSMAKYAVTAMTHLNLRDAPSAAIEQYSAPEVLSDWQSWYEQIKSGQRTFSFKGQAVEYRFNPDGTWDTIAIADPPDDGAIIQDTKATEPRPKTNPAPDPKPEGADNETMLYLLAVIAAFLAAAAVNFARRHFRTKH